MTDPTERQYSLWLSESELTLILSALEHFHRRQLFLENMAKDQAREKEALARKEARQATAKLSERIYELGATGGDPCAS